ncbi:MAG: site-2 protease family protein [Peptococcaceae bacterium]|jgi:Zn-dependent protease|nr:site-2 protease family protein [Peptococcaceae bacterium]
MSLFGNMDLAGLIANIPALLIGFAFHEYAHAWAAGKLGDPTPEARGRLTLNPLAHLDPIGTVLALVFRFGWAKPVPINPYNFRNPIRGRMLVSLAGPVTNLIIALIATMALVFMQYLPVGGGDSTVSQILWAIVQMNLGLGVFNLLPVPPLDGFAILAGLLPQRWALKLYALEPYGMIILAFVLITNVAGLVLSPIVGLLWRGYLSIAYMIVGLLS